MFTAGFFAFSPVEKASTVHGSLATSTALDTQTTLISTQADNQNRAIPFSYNLTHQSCSIGGVNGCSNNATLVPASPGKALTGFISMQAIENENGGVGNLVTNCGLRTPEGSTLAFNASSPTPPATIGHTSAGAVNASSFTTPVGEGIMVAVSNGSGTTGIGGVCQGILILTNWGS